MGIVWLAQDEELELKVALKFLPGLVAHDRASPSDLERETRRSLKLTHNNIVRIYDFVQDEQSASNRVQPKGRRCRRTRIRRRAWTVMKGIARSTNHFDASRPHSFFSTEMR